MSIVNELWVEKYRPKTIEDVVLPKEVKEEFTNTIKSGTLSNLLFSGPAGSGKCLHGDELVEIWIEED